MRMKSKGRSTFVGLKTKTRDSDEFRSVPKSINLPELPDEVWLRIIRSCDIRMEWNAIEAEQRDSQELLLSIAKTCSRFYNIAAPVLYLNPTVDELEVLFSGFTFSSQPGRLVRKVDLHRIIRTLTTHLPGYRLKPYIQREDFICATATFVKNCHQLAPNIQYLLLVRPHQVIKKGDVPTGLVIRVGADGCLESLCRSRSREFRYAFDYDPAETADENAVIYTTHTGAEATFQFGISQQIISHFPGNAALVEVARSADVGDTAPELIAGTLDSLQDAHEVSHITNIIDKILDGLDTADIIWRYPEDGNCVETPVDVIARTHIKLAGFANIRPLDWSEAALAQLRATADKTRPESWLMPMREREARINAAVQGYIRKYIADAAVSNILPEDFEIVSDLVCPCCHISASDEAGTITYEDLFEKDGVESSSSHE